MLEIWFSLGYILLLAVLLFAFILWRAGGIAVAIFALVVGLGGRAVGNRLSVCGGHCDCL